METSMTSQDDITVAKEYHKFLNDVGDLLLTRDVKKIKRVLSTTEHFSPGEVKDIEDDQDLFALLEQKGCMGPTNIKFLQQMFDCISNEDVSKKCEEYLLLTQKQSLQVTESTDSVGETRIIYEREAHSSSQTPVSAEANPVENEEETLLVDTTALKDVSGESCSFENSPGHKQNMQHPMEDIQVTESTDSVGETRIIYEREAHSSSQTPVSAEANPVENEEETSLVDTTALKDISGESCSFENSPGHKQNTQHLIEDIQVNVPDDMLDKISGQIGNDWESVMMQLGVKNQNIYNIKHNYPGNTKTQIRNCLIEWRSIPVPSKLNKNMDKKFEKLRQLLRDLDRNDIVEEIVKKFKEKKDLSDSLLSFISENYGSGWDSFLVQLGIPNRVINMCQLSLPDKILKFLQLWRDETTVTLKKFEELKNVMSENGIQEVVEFLEAQIEEEEKKNDYPRKNCFDTEVASTEEEEDLETEKKSLKVELRDYQVELAEKPLEKQNGIICAGTGSGKTYVAIHVMEDHLEKNPEGKIAFLAKTTALVTQQFRLIGQCLPRFKSIKFIGADDRNTRMHLFLTDHNIFVMTPMILVNALKDRKLDSIGIFSMIVIDECHHTRGNDPFNLVMRNYLLSKQKKEKLPQILGMTASIGTQNAKDITKAEDNIIQVMANLDCPNLLTVRKCLPSYQEHVCDPVTEHHELKGTSKNPIYNKIHESMRKAEEIIEKETTLERMDTLGAKGEKLRNSVIQKQNLTSPLEPSYLNWLVDVEKEARLLLLEKSDVPRNILTAVKFLKVYYSALEINKILSVSSVQSHLEFQLEDLTPPSQKTDQHRKQMLLDLKGVVDKINRLGQDEKEENPNLRLMMKILSDAMASNKDDGQFIIFVRTRFSAIGLAKFLNGKNIKCSHVTGIKEKTERGGMSAGEQANMLWKFRTGELQGIVATSVVEEGIDIPKCNIVIRYDYTGNEIKAIQVKGRSRAKDGVAHVIADHRKLYREYINIEQQALMNKAIETINMMPEDNLKYKISKYQNDTIEMLNRREKEETQIMSKTEEEFSLICSSCSHEIPGNAVRKLVSSNEYVLIDHEILGSVEEKRYEKKCKFEGKEKVAHMYGKCGDKWGAIFKITKTNARLYYLNISSFMVKTKGNPLQPLKEIKYSSLKIPEITEEEYRMLRSNDIPT